MKKALIITWERFQDHELVYPYYSLKENGFEVLVIWDSEYKDNKEKTLKRCLEFLKLE
jgi:putative intracellular protease/amidase